MKALRFLVLMVATIFAAVAEAQTVLPVQDVNEQTVERLIQRLDSPRFSERVRATAQLQHMGQAAIKPLEKVVLRGNSEAAERAAGSPETELQQRQSATVGGRPRRAPTHRSDRRSSQRPVRATNPDTAPSNGAIKRNFTAPNAVACGPDEPTDPGANQIGQWKERSHIKQNGQRVSLPR